ncbi:acyltransferase [Massilia sp. Dwa41.01b]|uniref:LpxL/LpxP family acyltransferase n=1 Tax=unclassified Massilia TaxID=2609279 RepID=UPI0015FEC63D|nr:MULTISPECIES: acyltransferase [unclassified Massilia]QNA91082.1 acyltransferase [Massilia sp. Dwa41.01b]QNB01468.1 acyltransferase [Massilia sp. Se16.2.3]
MRLLFWVCRVFGRWPFRVVLYPVLLWYVATQPRARRVSSDYLRRVGAPAGLFGVLRHFASFAETILDKMLLWGGLFDCSRVSLHGVEPLYARIREGRGALLVCSHLGNFDLSRAMSMDTPGLKITVLVHTRHAEAFNDMLAKLDPRSQMNLMQVTEMTPATAMALSERIERGEFVVMAADRVPVSPNPRVAMAPFLGQSAAFPVGPYVLASVLGCPLYTMFAIRQGDRHEIHFECLRERVVLPRRGRDEALAELAQDYAARLEHHARRAPLDWFNFYDFWHHPHSEHSNAAH